MAVVVRLSSANLAFGGPPLLAGAELVLAQGERICLVGRNGSGKSSLLRLLAGEIAPDAGTVERRQTLRVARLDQSVPATQRVARPGESVFDVVAGAGAHGRLLAAYHAAAARTAGGETRALHELDRAQRALETAGGWDHHVRVDAAISRLGLTADATFAALSGGMRRRVMLARALATEPELLLLDEPTNHLDIAAVLGLEELLLALPVTLVFVSHDRAFIDRLATRIVELDRGRLTSFPPPYAAYRERKTHLLEAEAAEAAASDRRLAGEEAWIRKGIEARRTRNEGRVRALLRMREERRARREREGSAQMQASAAAASGRLVLEASGVDFDWPDGTPCIRGLDALVLRGDRVGIIGPNGSGKTTLVRLLLGELSPTRGTIRHGTRLEVAYFDQLRARLDENASVRDNVAGGSDMVGGEGQRRHVIGYLRDFLFDAGRAATPVSLLSGGERNRLLLARLFARPSNLLVLDEPTNDLDMETLDLLEELLASYKGTVLLVSHDRALLEHVATDILAFEGAGRVRAYVGGYSDWVRQRPPPAPQQAAPRSPATPPPATGAPVGPRKMSYKETRELAALPARIEALEEEQAALHARMADPVFYREAGEAIAGARARLRAVESELGAAYARWEELEGLRA